MPGQGRPFAAFLATALAACALGGLVAPAIAQTAGPPRPPIDRADLESLSFPDATHGWAVGDAGAIWHTADGGATWTAQTSGVDVRLNGVHFIDAERGWAVGGAYLPGLAASRGLLLRTSDGGKTWTCERRLLLPRLRGVHFATPERGWVWGEPAGVYPTGVLSTSDGGRSWSPVAMDEADHASAATPQGWVDGAALRGEGLALLRRDGRLGRVRGGKVDLSEAPLADSSLYALAAMGNESRAIVVSGGDRGALDRTQILEGAAAPESLPLDASAAMPVCWRGAFAQSGRIWLVGDPGSIVLRSDDGGSQWRALPTGQRLPLADAAFVDESRGFAVGADGTILGTDDGGESWKVLRRGMSEADTLWLATDPTTVPWEWLAVAPRTVVWCVGNRVMADRAGSAGTRGARLSEALAWAGARSAGVEGLPMWPAEARADGAKTASVWEALSEARAVEALAERIDQLVRTWRPAIICSPAPEEASAPGLIGRAAGVAWDRWNESGPAADSALRLAPHVPRRWCVEQEMRGESPERLAHGSRMFEASIGGESVRAPVAYQVRAGEGVGLSGDAALKIPGNASEPESRWRADVAQRLRHWRAAVTFSERRAGSAALSGELEGMLAELDGDAAAAFLAELAASGAATEIDAANLLVERYADHPLAAEAAWRLWRRAASAEQESIEFEPLAEPAGEIRQAGDASAAPLNPSGATLRVDDRRTTRQQEAAKAAARLERDYPQVAYEPAARVSLAAWRRTLGRDVEAQQIVTDALRARPEDPWRRWLEGEAWLLAPRGECPAPLATCRLDAAKPQLDGRLDDATWKSAAVLPLASPWHDDGGWPSEAWIAADERYLYFAVRCRRANETRYEASNQTRERDADLAEFDRVSWRFDVDRDLNEHFELTVDQRGWGAERLSSGAAWDPRWFIASQLSEQEWVAEAAISWTELGIERPADDAAWALRILRIAPGAGLQVWPHEAEPDQPGPQSALLRFTAVGGTAPPGRLVPDVDAKPIPNDARQPDPLE